MPSPSLPRISNSDARRLFLQRHGLCTPAEGTAAIARLEQTIDTLGFVQIDSINTVARAHHMILRSRLGAYRESHLKRLYERERRLFEHWTHDASFIPIEAFPHWKLKFARDRERLSASWKKWQRHEFVEKFDEVLEHIASHGPATSGDVGKEEPRSKGGWWEWHPSKTALEFLWRTGALSVTRRDGFKKVYDLTENVVPEAVLKVSPTKDETIEFACSTALDRLGFATSGELAAFLDLITPVEAKEWVERASQAGRIIPVAIETAQGPDRVSFMWPETLEEIGKLPKAPGKVRILSPFDPLLRDRKRALRLFDFDYRIEVFVPEAQRKYGYYVFPVLEGERVIGRIDMKAQRNEGTLAVRKFWPELRIMPSKARLKSLEKELERMASFCGLDKVSYEQEWLPSGFIQP